VSGYEYDYDEPAGAGIDTGSLGRNPYLYDPEMTQPAADAGRDSVAAQDTSGQKGRLSCR
jgi:hypothetical protein